MRATAGSYLSLCEHTQPPRHRGPWSLSHTRSENTPTGLRGTQRYTHTAAHKHINSGCTQIRPHEHAHTLCCWLLPCSKRQNTSKGWVTGGPRHLPTALSLVLLYPPTGRKLQGSVCCLHPLPGGGGRGRVVTESRPGVFCSLQFDLRFSKRPKGPMLALPRCLPEAPEEATKHRSGEEGKKKSRRIPSVQYGPFESLLLQYTLTKIESHFISIQQQQQQHNSFLDC